MTIQTISGKKSLLRSGDFQETIADGLNGNPISLEDKVATITIVAGAGTGKAQTTTSGEEAIKAGNANWIDWSKGDVTGSSSDVLTGPVSAVRGVSVSGEITIEIVV